MFCSESFGYVFGPIIVIIMTWIVQRIICAVMVNQLTAASPSEIGAVRMVTTILAGIITMLCALFIACNIGSLANDAASKPCPAIQIMVPAPLVVHTNGGK